MLDKTMSRARKADLDRIVQPLLCNGDDIGSTLIFDFALMSNALHETPDPESLLHKLLAILKPGAKFLLTEPAGHLKPTDFEAEVTLATTVGFQEIDRPQLMRQMTVLLQKNR
jgi:SAM-dependent methyltransferase